jgi:transposase
LARSSRALRELEDRLQPVSELGGRPLHVTLTPDERHEMVAARELLDHAHGGAFIGDTGYDSNEFREEIKAQGIKAVNHSKPERKRARPLDRKLYRIRYLVELCFHTPKRFRAIGTRDDKTKRSYLALLHVACICVWLS